MFAAFMELTKISTPETLLDVGVTSDRSYHHSNYLEAWCPHKTRITAVGIDDASFLEDLHPGIRFIRADGCRLPFENGAFDYAHSSAVLEHVGSRHSQAQFLRELSRVARRGIFLATPNRWFPIEFHTMLPLLHWLPPPLYRKALVGLGKAFFADENNLNLLSRRDLGEVARTAGIKHFSIKAVSLFGFPTNLLLFAQHLRV